MGDDSPLSRRDALDLGSITVLSVLISRLPWDAGYRQQLLAELDPIARHLGTYTAYTLSRLEYVGIVEHGGERLDLREEGYGRNPLSAAKFHPDTGELDDSSWRRVDRSNERWQWHVHAWERRGGRAEVFSHYEYRPDFTLLGGESPAEMRARLRDHYDPKWNTEYDDQEANYFVGCACDRVRALAGDS